MKKILFTFAFLMMMANAYSQSHRFAGKLGYVNSNLRLKNAYINTNFEARSSIYLGFQGEYFFSPKFSAQAEWTMVGLGANNVPSKVEYQNQTFEGNIDIHLGTHRIPLGIKFYPSQKLALLGGFNLGFITLASTKIKDEKVRLKNMETSNHSFFLGGEFKIYKNLFLDARYNFGVSDVKFDSSATTRNNYFQIGLGWYFDEF